MVAKFYKAYELHAVRDREMVLSACKDDALSNTVEDQTIKGHLGNDVYSYQMSETHVFTDTGGSDQLRLTSITF